MSGLKALFNMIDSQNAAYSAVLRLKNACEYVTAAETDLFPGLIYYLLDPMICMGVEDISGVLSFIEQAALKKELDEVQVQSMRQFVESHRPDFLNMLAFMTEMNNFTPQTKCSDEIKAEIRLKLEGNCKRMTAEVKKNIVDDVYLHNELFWKAQ